MKTVVNEHGIEINFYIAVCMIDDGLREEIHRDISPCSDQEFFNAYAAVHLQRFGEEWEPAKLNPTI